MVRLDIIIHFMTICTIVIKQLYDTEVTLYNHQIWVSIEFCFEKESTEQWFFSFFWTINFTFNFWPSLGPIWQYFLLFLIKYKYITIYNLQIWVSSEFCFEKHNTVQQFIFAGLLISLLISAFTGTILLSIWQFVLLFLIK